MSTSMSVGKGYIVRAPNTYSATVTAPFTASFVGVPNNGTYTTPITGGASQFNLLGNPYPSALYATDFINGNTNVSGTLYFWTHNTPINANQYALNGDYASYNLSGGLAATNSGTGNTSIPLGYIASGQGFFVKGLSNSPAVFTNNMRRAGNNAQFYRSATDISSNDLERHRYWLNITNTEGAFKQALVAYVETATSGIDRLFDGDLVEAGNVISLYTKVDATKLSIQGRPLPFDVADTVPLSYKSTIASTYTITMPEYDGLFTTQHVYLEDTLLQVIHDLSDSPYTFATEIGTFEDRFVLRYTNTALGNPNFESLNNSVVVATNHGELIIKSHIENIQEVTVYDILGRELFFAKAIDTTSFMTSNISLSQQALIVKIKLENGLVVSRKIIL